MDDLVKYCNVDSRITDHSAVHVMMSCSQPHPARKTVKDRNMKKIDIEKRRNYILSSELITKPPSNVDYKVSQYNSILSFLLDKHAPGLLKHIAIKDNPQWMNEKKIQMPKEGED